MAESPTPPGGAAERALQDGTRDQLIREEPLLIRIGEQQLLTMRTPGHDEDLALGFMLSEGVIASPGDVDAFRFVPGDAAALRADTLDLRLVPQAHKNISGKLTRVHEIRSSCGICGIVDPQELLEETPPLLPGVPRLELRRLGELQQSFQGCQPDFGATGACHGAVLFGEDLTILGHGEDVGRHNALDKAIGAAARAGHDLSRAIAMLSGRTGYDLVIKCLRLRIAVILSVSAPSALTFDLCSAAGATLVGFVRGARHKVYWDGGRLA